MLTELANSGDDFVNAFNVFLTYPFVDEVVGRDPQVARNLHMGDYTNLSIELTSTSTTSVPTDAARPTCRSTRLRQIPALVTSCLRERQHRQQAPARSSWPRPRSCAKLREECAEGENREQGRVQAARPDPRPAESRGGTTGSGPLPGLPGLPGLPRAGFGSTASSWQSTRGPTHAGS